MMNAPRVLVTRRWPEPVEAQLSELYDVKLNTGDKPLSPSEMRSAVSEFDVILPTP